MGNKSGKGKSSGQEISDDELEVILANTDMDRFQIIEWHDGFIKVQLKSFRSLT